MEIRMPVMMLGGSPFKVHCKGSVTGLTWSGDFRSKAVLTFKEQMAVDRLRREFIGPDAAGADPDAVAQAIILSELAFRLTEAPQWWTEAQGGQNLSDPNLLQEVYKAAKKIEDDYFAALAKSAEADRETIRAEKDKPEP